MDHQTMHSTLRKNPSRQTCETIIKRILMTEVLEKGTNRHFKQASDFMSYFESLYPASDSLAKQVQRAVKSMNMPKDSNGYFIINKSREQLEQEKASASVEPLEEYETVFLRADAKLASYLMDTIEGSITFQDKYITMVKTSNGILFYTLNKPVLVTLLNSLIEL